MAASSAISTSIKNHLIKQFLIGIAEEAAISEIFHIFLGLSFFFIYYEVTGYLFYHINNEPHPEFSPFEVKLPSMHYRRERGNMIMVYQILIGGIRIDHTRIFQRAPPDTTTRGHSLKLSKPSANCVQRQNAFSHRVVNKWNSLPEEVVVNVSPLNLKYLIYS